MCYAMLCYEVVFTCMERIWRELYVTSARRNHDTSDRNACPTFGPFLAARFDALMRDLRAHWGCA